VATSSHAFNYQFKSPLRVAVRFLFRSRETQKERASRKDEELREVQKQLEESRSQTRQLGKQLDEQAKRIHELEQELKALREQPLRLPHDPKLPHHSFGAKMISMCCNLAVAVGFRAAERALKIFWEYLGLTAKLPAFETIRTWLMRVGIARLLLNKRKMKDGQVVWFVDHSCKVGREKVLAILGIRLEDLPPPGTPLKHEDLMTLLVAVGKDWKREDVAEQYDQLIKQMGVPLVINSDEAVELQEPALALKNGEKTVLVQTDPKHKLANIIKSVIGKDERFLEFQKRLGQTRSAIQQTELSHFTPPKQKTKARFMNLQNTIRWAAMVQWHLTNACSKARAEIEPQRMREKLGWLGSFRKDIASWQRCLDVVGATLKFINKQGLSAGASGRLKRELDNLDLCPTSREVAERTLAFIKESETKLRSLKQPDLRVPMSTEVLESVFGRYKQLERQHSHGGFTSLLASFATLLKPITPDEIKEAFEQVSTKEMKQWVKDQLGNTLQSKKNQAYAEYKFAVQT
jgi:flagellar motor protein MotB